MPSVVYRLGREVGAEPNVEPGAGYSPRISWVVVFLVVGGFVVGETKAGATESICERELFELNATKKSALRGINSPETEAK